MDFNPSSFDPLAPVLVVKPTVKARSTEAGGITSKAGLPSLERQTTLGNQVHENGADCLALQGVENGVVAEELTDKPFIVCGSEITHEPTPGNGGIDLKHSREKSVRYGKRATPFLGSSWFRNASTQILEQDLEVVLLIGLSGIVGRPVLPGGPYGCTLSIPILFAYPVLNEPFRCVLNNPRVIGNAGEIELSLIHGDLPSFVGKDRGKLKSVGLLRCHERLAGDGPVR